MAGNCRVWFFFTGMVLMNAVMLQVAFLFCRDSQWALKTKFLAVPGIQPQNVFNEVTTEESPLALKFHQKFWLWPLLFSSYKQLCSFILQWQATAGLLHRGRGSKCSGCMLQSTESLQHRFLPHVCSKRVQFNNPLAFKKQRPVLKHSCSDLCCSSFHQPLDYLLAFFHKRERCREGRGFTWIIFLIWFSQITASADQPRSQTADWEARLIVKAGRGRNQTSFAAKEKTGRS